MSFDVYFQRFAAGAAADGGGAEMRTVLEPHAQIAGEGLLRVKFGDGEADVYLSDSGMMANHISGEDQLAVDQPVRRHVSEFGQMTRLSVTADPGTDPCDPHAEQDHAAPDRGADQQAHQHQTGANDHGEGVVE